MIIFQMEAVMLEDQYHQWTKEGFLAGKKKSLSGYCIHLNIEILENGCRRYENSHRGNWRSPKVLGVTMPDTYRNRSQKLSLR